MKLFGLTKRIAMPTYCVVVGLATQTFAFASADTKAMVRRGTAVSNAAASSTSPTPTESKSRRLYEQCLYEYIGSGNSYQKKFYPPDYASCRVDCDKNQGGVTWFASADEGYSLGYPWCGDNSASGKTGISIEVRGSNYRNLKVTCWCPEDNSAPPPSEEGGGACFWEGATVEVLDKGIVTMNSLNVGDLVLTSEGHYEPVFAFAHQDKISNTNFLEISFLNKSLLKISPEHLVLVEGHYIPAKSIQIGSLLRDGKGGTMAVKKIRSVDERGLYAPLTPSGKLLVDGVQTSCYISLQKNHPATLGLGGLSVMSQHMFAHILLSPIRMVCLGISSKLCTSDLIIDPTTGYAWFVDKVAFPIVEVIEHSWTMAALLSIFFGTFWALEYLVGASLGPLVAVLFISCVFSTLMIGKEKIHVQQKAPARKRSSNKEKGW